MMATEQLSHDEVWDDSALVDSWNEALEEYKKYHSIAARGERVEDVVAAAEQAELSTPEVPVTTNKNTGLPAWEPKDQEMEEKPQSEPEKELVAESVVDSSIQLEDALPAEQTQHVANGITTAMPQALMNTVQDEGLKNLMMSWYYAGYYTGLYEGQQKANAAQPSSDHSNSKVS